MIILKIKKIYIYIYVKIYFNIFLIEKYYAFNYRTYLHPLLSIFPSLKIIWL
jgi:hypothetical protein